MIDASGDLRRTPANPSRRDPSPAGPDDQFIGVLAHDLRNPLAIVRASAQMAARQINRGNLPAAELRLGLIVAQCDRATDLLERFVDAARLRSGALPLRLQRVDLRDVLTTAIARARLAAGDFGDRAVETDIAGGCLGDWDATRLERCVQAVLENAFLYGPPETAIRVQAERFGGNVVLEIDAGGPGPTAEDTKHLFEQFFRGQAAGQVEHAGSGLGLFTARGIARAHGGDVRQSTSAPSSFEIELPLAGTSTEA